MEKITKERLRYISNDIQTIETHTMTNKTLIMGFGNIEKNKMIDYINHLEYGEITIYFKNGDIRTYLLID